MLHAEVAAWQLAANKAQAEVADLRAQLAAAAQDAEKARQEASHQLERTQQSPAAAVPAPAASYGTPDSSDPENGYSRARGPGSGPPPGFSGFGGDFQPADSAVHANPAASASYGMRDFGDPGNGAPSGFGGSGYGAQPRRRAPTTPTPRHRYTGPDAPELAAGAPSLSRYEAAPPAGYGVPPRQEDDSRPAPASGFVAAEPDDLPKSADLPPAGYGAPPAFPDHSGPQDRQP